MEKRRGYYDDFDEEVFLEKIILFIVKELNMLFLGG